MSKASSQQYAIGFWEVKSSVGIFNNMGVHNPNLCFVQVSTVGLILCSQIVVRNKGDNVYKAPGTVHNFDKNSFLSSFSFN